MARTKGVWWQGQWWPDPRGTRAWRKLRDQVVSDEPLCWLRLAGCTTLSTTADHVTPFKERPDLSMLRGNLRGACHHCNSSRQDRKPKRCDDTEALGWFE
jgi:5-methylcytosine-specific restriction endonuclease McrA